MKEERFYCENCGLDDLTQDETTADEQGGIFCSEKCKEEFKEVKE